MYDIQTDAPALAVSVSSVCFIITYIHGVRVVGKDDHNPANAVGVVVQSARSGVQNDAEQQKTVRGQVKCSSFGLKGVYEPLVKAVYPASRSQSVMLSLSFVLARMG